jgi:hypothetical protein
MAFLLDKFPILGYSLLITYLRDFPSSLGGSRRIRGICSPFVAQPRLILDTSEQANIDETARFRVLTRSVHTVTLSLKKIHYGRKETSEAPVSSTEEIQSFKYKTTDIPKGEAQPSASRTVGSGSAEESHSGQEAARGFEEARPTFNAAA